MIIYEGTETEREKAICHSSCSYCVVKLNSRLGRLTTDPPCFIRIHKAIHYQMIFSSLLQLIIGIPIVCGQGSNPWSMTHNESKTWYFPLTFCIEHRFLIYADPFIVVPLKWSVSS